MTQLLMPAGCYFGAVIRNEKIIMYHQDTVLADGDHVIFFIARRKAVQDLEKMIQVKLGFFA